jgi:hypothetical protein
VHRELGPGLLETVYEVVLARELTERRLKVVRQVPVKNSLCAPAPLREKNKFQQQAATSPGYRRRRALTLSMSVHVRKHAGEVGYIVNAQYWNNGYATEASSAIMRWLVSESGIHSDNIMIDGGITIVIPFDHEDSHIHAK